MTTETDKPSEPGPSWHERVPRWALWWTIVTLAMALQSECSITRMYQRNAKELPKKLDDAFRTALDKNWPSPVPTYPKK